MAIRPAWLALLGVSQLSGLGACVRHELSLLVPRVWLRLALFSGTSPAHTARGFKVGTSVCNESDLYREARVAVLKSDWAAGRGWQPNPNGAEWKSLLS